MVSSIFFNLGDMFIPMPFLYDMVWNVNAHLLQPRCVCVCDSKPNMLKHTDIRIAHIKNISSSQNCMTRCTTTGRVQGVIQEVVTDKIHQIAVEKWSGGGEGGGLLLLP